MAQQLRIARVIRADALVAGDLTLDGDPIEVAALVEHQSQLEQRTEDANRGQVARSISAEPIATEIVGDAPAEIELRVGKKTVSLSPSDLIVVLR